MAYLRFDPHDYQTLSRLCRSQDLAERPLRAFRRLLLSGLAEDSPRLAGDVAALSRQRLRLLHKHFRERPRPERRHGLTDVEVEAILASRVPLLSQCRFFHLLKRALVRRLAASHVALAAKVERMSLGQFEGLCKEVRDQGR
jgi:hypothetical protein